jgi:hypothetical protein
MRSPKALKGQSETPVALPGRRNHHDKPLAAGDDGLSNTRQSDRRELNRGAG